MMELRIYIYLKYVVFITWMSTTGAIDDVYMDRNCGQTKYLTSDTQLRVRLTDNVGYHNNMDCSFTVVSGLFGSNLMMAFKDLDIESSRNCYQDRLSLIDGQHTYGRHIGQRYFCGKTTPGRIYNTSSDTLTLHFVSGITSHLHSGFEIIITQYSTGDCYSWDIKCDNGRCIDESLSCSGYNPCGDHSDCSLSTQAIYGIVIGSLSFIALMIVFISVTIRMRRRIAYGTPTQRSSESSIATISNQQIQTPPPYSQVVQDGYNQPVPPSLNPVPPYNIPYQTGSDQSSQQMVSYPPPYAPPPYSEEGQPKY